MARPAHSQRSGCPGRLCASRPIFGRTSPAWSVFHVAADAGPLHLFVPSSPLSGSTWTFSRTTPALVLLLVGGVWCRRVAVESYCIPSINNQIASSGLDTSGTHLGRFTAITGRTAPLHPRSARRSLSSRGSDHTGSLGTLHRGSAQGRKKRKARQVCTGLRELREKGAPGQALRAGPASGLVVERPCLESTRGKSDGGKGDPVPYKVKEGVKGLVGFQPRLPRVRARVHRSSSSRRIAIAGEKGLHPRSPRLSARL